MAQYISEPVKFLGKLYVDRTPNERPDPELLFNAVDIIQRKARKMKGKEQVAFFTTSEKYDEETGSIHPAALCGRLRDGTMAFVQPMITIVSIGHTNKSFVYVTVEPGETDGMLRFWIYAFSCRSKDMGVKLANHIISRGSILRKQYRQRRAQGIAQGKMSKVGNSAIPEAGTPNYEDPNPDITMALEAQAEMQSAPEQQTEGNMETTTVNEDDFQLATTALAEMYDLDCALQRYRLPEAFRSKLMDAWKKGYEEGGCITQNCNGNPAEVNLNLSMVQV